MLVPSPQEELEFLPQQVCWRKSKNRTFCVVQPKDCRKTITEYYLGKSFPVWGLSSITCKAQRQGGSPEVRADCSTAHGGSVAPSRLLAAETPAYLPAAMDR